MLFMIVFEYSPENRQETVARFMDTGAPPPDGVVMIGRWHDAAMGRGYTLADAPDAQSVAMWCHRWADLITMEIVPVIHDEQMTKVLSS